MLTLVIPPFTQLNTAYPSVLYLARFLKENGIESVVRDFSIEVANQVFSRDVFIRIFEAISRELEDGTEYPEEVWRMWSQRDQICAVIDRVLLHLQGRDPSLHVRITSQNYLPKTPRLLTLDLEHFGTMGTHDASRYMCTLFLEDLTDLIKCCIDLGFDFGKYQAYLATGSISLDPILERLSETTLIDEIIDAMVESIDSPCVAISIPFAGTLYAGFRLGRLLKERGKVVWIGGGYVNTELRECQDERIWQFCDALSYDDGEEPLLRLVQRYQGKSVDLIRTRTSDGLHWNAAQACNPFTSVADYSTLQSVNYLHLVDSIGPAHRMWSDGRWNKFTLAHGCYWKKCSFCDIRLDYIERYVPAPIIRLVDQLEEVIEQTGISGFHFVDEAAPPRVLRDFALEVIRRDLTISFWGNIRFEKAFTPDLCRLLARAGLIMVTGGLEVADERLLKLMNKGVSLPQVISCTRAFKDAGVLVHAYLMYGFPSQTHRETMASMEMVRQLFQAELLDSAFWHRFVLTKHSGVYANPNHFKVAISPVSQNVFATNDIEHVDLTGDEHDVFDDVLPVALAHWMRKEHLDVSVTEFFEQKMPDPMVDEYFVQNHLDTQVWQPPKGTQRVIWTGYEPLWMESGVQMVGMKGELWLEEPDDVAGIQRVFDALDIGEVTVSDALEALNEDLELLEALNQVGLLFV